jgi:two-component system, NtrC family, nitrogen regulation sensor histidine kinase NtrY
MTTKNEIPPLDPREKMKRKRERIAIFALTILFFALMLIEFRITKVSATLPFVNSIFFFGLVNLNIIILILLLWLVIRNVGKLFLERRRNLLGARLKTKLVISFLAFSIIPTIVLFIISALYINTTFDKWFSLKIQNTLQTSLDITRLYYRGADETTNHFAVHLSKLLTKKLSQPKLSSESIQEYLEAQRDLLALDYVEYYSDFLEERILAEKDIEEVDFSIPRMSLETLEVGLSGKPSTVLHHTPAGDLIRAMVPVKAMSNSPSTSPTVGVVVVSRFVPVTLTDKVDEISSVIEDYKDINPLKYPVKTAYLLILIMITLMIIFVAIWIGLFIAKELTVPVERLVKGAQAVGAGNLDFVINASGRDEIAVLVESFNKMTRDLKENRERLTEATRDLEKRKFQLEAILSNVGTGVISVDQGGVIQTFNRAAGEILILNPEVVQGKTVEQSFSGDLERLAELFRTDHAVEILSPVQINLTLEGLTKIIAATITEIPSGLVVVIDDVTHLVKGQREMAWREVARRIAHEIKNPLTPIKLSAQRLQRRLSDLTGKEGVLLRECTETIIQHTDELKEMVNEFSLFARMPEISTNRYHLDEMLRETVTLYSQAHPQVLIVYQPDTTLPEFEFDRDQMKRVLINLLDNAVAVLEKQPHPQIILKTHYHSQLQIAVIDFKDNGPGMTEEVRSRVFEPYFSTKSEGTGLGLAIVKRIISDHHGFIRVHSQPGEGTQFLIELPTASVGKV